MYNLKHLRGGQLENKVAVITGAGSGIGKATTDVFLRAGATVVAADINYDTVCALKEEFKDYADRIHPVRVDVGDRESVEAMIDYAIRECGKMDIIYNNAGIMDSMTTISELTDERWDLIMRVNTSGVMYACRKAVQYFLETENKHGVIINTASVGGLFGGRAGLAYTASKHAVVGMTKNIAFMYGDTGIRCNAICPGAVATNIGTGAWKLSERGMSRMQNGMGLSDRYGDPYEIAGAALFLASDDSSFVNGETLTVDGGWSSY